MCDYRCFLIKFLLYIETTIESVFVTLMNETDHYNFFKHYCMLRFVQVALFIFSCINGFVQGQIEPVLNENSIKIIESRIVDSILNVERVNLNEGLESIGNRSFENFDFLQFECPRFCNKIA